MAKKYYLKGGLFLLITTVYLFVAIWLGIPLAVKIAELVGKDKGSIVVDNASIILPPRLNYLPTATNSAELNVSGSATANQVVDIYLNDIKETETMTDADGYFEKSVVLNLGKNQIYAMTRDANGGSSGTSNQMSISFLDIAPELTVTEPVNGAEIRQKDNYIMVKGNTEVGMTLKVNNRLGVISADGSFSHRLNLSEGENTIIVEAIDNAGNVKKVELKVNFRKR